jgi:hypothetical protein
MKNSASLKSILFLLLLIISNDFKAQISIVASDWEPLLQVGQEYTSYSDSTTSQVNIGATGETSWDFTGLVADNTWKTVSKPVASSPYIADFSGAEYVSNYEGTFKGVYSNSWIYSSIGEDYKTLGTGTVANTPAGNLITKIKFSPAWSHYSFPIQVGYMHTYTGTQSVTSIITIPGFGEFPTSINQTYTDNQVVDAWGIIKMPDGKRLNAIRLKETITIVSELTSSTSVRFIFLTKTGEMVSVSPVNSNVTSGLVAVIEVSWYNGSGVSIPEETVNIPSSLSATAIGNSINIGWTDNSNNETGFTIERAAGSGSFSPLVSVGANVVSYSDATATAGIEYSYRVKANGGTSGSGYSNTAKATIPAVVPVADPTGLTATLSGNSINIGWSDNATNETGYTIERAAGSGSFSPLVSVGANVVSYSDATATAGIEYSYRVKANGGTSGSGYSNTAKATVPVVVPVADPTGLTAAVSGNSINIGWSDNATNETGFTIERAEGSGSFSPLVSVGANVVSYSDASVRAGIEYSYRVKANGGTTGSGYSNTAKSTIPAVVPVADPTGLTATVSGNSINIGWSDNSTNETGFTIERAAGSGSFSPLVLVGANVVSYSDATATAGIEYSYRVKANGGTSGSGYSNTEKSTIPAVVPVADPTGLTAAVSGNSINIGWSDNSTNETGFVVERSEAGGGFSELATVGVNITTYSDASAVAGIEYTYRVKANGSTVNSEYSNTATASITEVVGVNEMHNKNFSLRQNYPNPFNSSTTISFNLNQNDHISIRVYDVTGKFIEQLADSEFSEGKHSVIFERKGLSKGIYFYSLVTKRSSETRKMVVE